MLVRLWLRESRVGYDLATQSRVVIGGPRKKLVASGRPSCGASGTGTSDLFACQLTLRRKERLKRLCPVSSSGLTRQDACKMCGTNL